MPTFFYTFVRIETIRHENNTVYKTTIGRIANYKARRTPIRTVIKDQKTKTLHSSPELKQADVLCNFTKPRFI